MSRLPRLTGQIVVQALSRAGFKVIRQRGSHVFLKHTDGRATVIPVHSSEVLGPGIMSKIRLKKFNSIQPIYLIGIDENTIYILINN